MTFADIQPGTVFNYDGSRFIKTKLIYTEGQYGLIGPFEAVSENGTLFTIDKDTHVEIIGELKHVIAGQPTNLMTSLLPVKEVKHGQSSIRY